MTTSPRASVIINNYNYGRFLADAIDSALGQTYPRTEVVVVDDGSTDGSRSVLAGYGGRVVPVLKANGGQASAFNAGFAASRGDVVMFLDADDTLAPTAVERAAGLLAEPGVVKAHWPLREVDQDGRLTGQLRPGGELPEGDLREEALRLGPDSYVTPPTTGNAFSRAFLERVTPVPENTYRICADAYLFGLAPLFGLIRRDGEPQGYYRVHAQNHYAGMRFIDKLKRDLMLYDHRCLAMGRFCRELGIDADPEGWSRNSWLHRLERATREIEALVPPSGTFILVDEDNWGTDETLAGRRRIPFLERDGQYWGRPPDDETAIREVERLRQAGAGFLIFAWPAFWWLDYFPELQGHLRLTSQCISQNDRLVAFDLRR
jgi:glycosyltransferase involved in cell wall biosynthesis